MTNSSCLTPIWTTTKCSKLGSFSVVYRRRKKGREGSLFQMRQSGKRELWYNINAPTRLVFVGVCTPTKTGRQNTSTVMRLPPSFHFCKLLPPFYGSFYNSRTKNGTNNSLACITVLHWVNYDESTNLKCNGSNNYQLQIETANEQLWEDSRHRCGTTKMLECTQGNIFCI